ncbi:hypothetical protein ASC77_22660 [Nocardioides sp. Root1257]|uniref:hypothetical protein n=1 Tax=unclassified Nocardioides TaxID=2615069 RepID=UPI0006F29F52|nr:MULTISPECIES: hypothetical protein [unclassified Nocardioides]KQW43090.1 hypothetical protein ASC77_22660 [Nocardioides sp. Root1257]KRC41958.1 hypothetical protein ASE24_22450 [Nocardioides sp. Root224]
MTHDDPTELGTALRDRVRDEDPDLDQLIRVSTRTGTRMRRRRTAAAGLGCVVAGVAVVGILGSSLGGSDDTTGTDPGVATQPTPTASATPPPPDVVQPTAQRLPVTVVLGALPDWEVGTAADDKFPVSKGDSFLTVVTRPMSEYDSWSGDDPDHPSDQVVHVGANYFVTVQPADDVPLDVLHELLDALRYETRWKK